MNGSFVAATAAVSESGEDRYFKNAFAPASFFGLADMQSPSIGASRQSAPMAGSISGNVKKSRSVRSFSGNCSFMKVPSRYMPAFFCCNV
jgi:hypothetical protein